MYFTSESERSFWTDAVLVDESNRIDEVYKQFEELGLATLASSRLRTYRRVFAKLSDTARQPLGLPDALAIFETLIDVRQLQTIAKATERAVDRDAWLRQLGRLVGGPTSFRAASDSPVLDFQFEMYLASVASLGGCTVGFAEPDIVVEFDGKRFGIAAKHPRRPRQIEKRIRSAVRQIERSGVPGLVALDLSHALYPDLCINTNATEGAQQFLKIAADRAAMGWYERLGSVFKSDAVLGLLVHIELPALVIENGSRLISAARWTIVCSGHARASWALDFANRCRPGVA